MRFDKKIDVQKLTEVSDGMGGYTEAWTTISTFDAVITPLGDEMQLKLQGFITKKAIKAISRDVIPNEDGIRFSNGNENFKLFNRKIYARHSVLILEMI
jgi:hypothetical protein